ncbi:MAG: hypothetical protein IK132_15205 [Clostridia bacterium]|nr:hypothetical protein [Clostridia bacterium]
MNGLISIDGLSLRPISDELLALNEVSRAYGLTLTAEEARELSETRKTALTENVRVEAGIGAVPQIVKKFCTSRYMNADNYTYVLNEITYLFYYIKTETDDKIGDQALIDELFERFELYCRGSIDVLEGREAERIIRKINAGKHYTEWFGERDEVGVSPDDRLESNRDTPDNLLDDAFGTDHFRDDENDRSAYEDEEDPASILDAAEGDDPYDDFGGPGEDEDALGLYDEVGMETLEEDDPANPLNQSGVLDVRFGDAAMQLSVGGGPLPYEDEDGDVDLDLFDRFFDLQAQMQEDGRLPILPGEGDDDLEDLDDFDEDEDFDEYDKYDGYDGEDDDESY